MESQQIRAEGGGRAWVAGLQKAVAVVQ
jgi:hypothetical protein